MSTDRLFVVSALACFALLAASTPARAIDKCKVKVDSKTGVLTVSATGVVGTLQWGSAAGSEDQAFFNPSCVASGTAKGCQLADPLTLASKTPPDGCTIYLDDGTAPCSTWIKGCTPGRRSSASLVWKDSNGAIAGASDDTGQVLFRKTGDVVVRIAMQGGSNFQEAGAFHYNSPDCTGTALVPGDTGPFRNVTVPDSYSSLVYYAPDGGSYQSDGSVLHTSVIIMSPLDCFSYYPGSTFIGPNSCCQPLGSMQYLTIPALVDFTGVAFPITPTLQ